MNGMALIFIIGCVSLLMLAMVLPRNRPVKKKEPVISKADELMYEARISLRDFPEEQKWLETQALRVGFIFPEATKARVPITRKPLPATGGTPVRLPTETGLLEINGSWFQKFNSPTGSYLKEVAAPRAQEEVHEESTTVRDFSGRIITEHRCTCTSCSSSDVPDSIRYSGLPARVAAAIQHPGSVLPDQRGGQHR